MCGSVTPCEGRPERASKAGCGAVIGAAPRLGWTDVGRIGHGLDRGATTSASELSAMTLGLRGILERIEEARSNGISQKIRGEWVVFAMVDSETCVKGMEKAWRSRDDSWLVGEEDGDLLETINNLRWELWRTLRGLVVRSVRCRDMLRVLGESRLWQWLMRLRSGLLKECRGNQNCLFDVP